MAAADVSALLDVASVPDAPAAPSPAAAAAEPAADDFAALQIDDTSSQDAAPREGAPEAPADAAAGGDKIDVRNNPDAIRKGLRAFRDAAPENRPIAIELNNGYGRYLAYRDVFPKVQDARDAKFLLDSIGGGDGLTTLQNTIRSVNETDALLYAGDPRVLDSLLDDMKAAGKPDAFGKLASPFLDKLRDVDAKSYYAALRPHFYQGIVDSGLPDVLDGLEAALSAQADGKPAPNLDTIRALVGEMRKWYTGLDRSVADGRKSALDPERQSLAADRAKFDSDRRKAFEGDVNTEWNRINNKYLGEALRPYLRLPFAKSWTDATKRSVASEITRTFLDDLTNDKSYQSQMDAFFSEASPDKSRIARYHEDKAKLIAKRIVQSVLEARYPGFSSVKGAPKPATAAGAKPAAAAAQPSGKPIYQTAKPKWEEVDWNRDPNKLLYITGRFYDKKGVLRTWSQKYK